MTICGGPPVTEWVSSNRRTAPKAKDRNRARATAAVDREVSLEQRVVSESSGWVTRQLQTTQASASQQL